MCQIGTVTNFKTPTFAPPFRSKTPRVEAFYSLRTGSVMLNYNPIPIVSWEFVEPGTIIRDFVAQPKEFVRVLFENGQVLLAKRHPTVHLDRGTARLYGAEGESRSFFSLSSNGLNEIKPVWNKAMEKGEGGSKYAKLAHFIDDSRKSGLLCHHASWEIWHGPRDTECHIHHLNRDKFDWCEANLVQLKKKHEHPNADARQKLIESAVGDLHRLSYAQLLNLEVNMPNNEFLHELQKLRQQFK